MVTHRSEINTAVILGKPVVRCTYIPVELIIRKLSEGATQADVLDACPRLTREDIQAALTYSADALAHKLLCLYDPGDCLVSEEDRYPLGGIRSVAEPRKGWKHD